MTPPLERMYPARCYDCLTPVPMGDVLCAACAALYRKRREAPASD